MILEMETKKTGRKDANSIQISDRAKDIIALLMLDCPSKASQKNIVEKSIAWVASQGKAKRSEVLGIIQVTEKLNLPAEEPIDLPEDVKRRISQRAARGLRGKLDRIRLPESETA